MRGGGVFTILSITPLKYVFYFKSSEITQYLSSKQLITAESVTESMTDNTTE